MTKVIPEYKKEDHLTENDILNSLNSAISAYETKDFATITNQASPKLKSSKKGRPKKIHTNPVQALDIPVSFEEEVIVPQIEIVEEKIELPVAIKKVKKVKAKVKTIEPVKLEVKEKRQTKKIKTKLKKSKFIKRKSFLKRINFITPAVNGTKSIASKYKKHFMTAGLTLAMFTFAGLSTYIAYAYVANGSNDVVGKVSSHIILPTSETPKVYIIQSDKSEIFTNPLFKGIMVGDNVLSYPSSGKVIIYRSSEDKIVNIVNTGE